MITFELEVDDDRVAEAREELEACAVVTGKIARTQQRLARERFPVPKRRAAAPCNCSGS